MIDIVVTMSRGLALEAASLLKQCSPILELKWSGTLASQCHSIAAGIEKVVSTQWPPPAKKGVYVASRASIPGRPAMWQALRNQGYPIVSSWIDGGECDWSVMAQEIAGSAGLILYVHRHDLPIKGALVEVGMALAARIPVVVLCDDFTMDPETFRPLGSWVTHPFVGMGATMAGAFISLGFDPTTFKSIAPDAGDWPPGHPQGPPGRKLPLTPQVAPDTKPEASGAISRRWATFAEACANVSFEEACKEFGIQ